MVRYALALIGFLGLATAGTALLSAQAAEPSLSEQQRSLLDAREQSERARQRSDALRRQAQAASNDADRIASEAAALAARIQAAEADIRAARTRIAIVARLQQGQRARLAEKQGPMIRLTAALQMMTRKPTALALVEPRSLDELIYMRSILSAVMPEIERRTASLRDEVRQGVQLRQQAVRAIASLDESQRRLGERRRQLAGLEASERIAATQFSSDAGIEQEQALALGEEARDIMDLMDEIRESGAVRESLAALEGPVLRPGQGQESPVRTARQESDVANAYRLPVLGEIVTGLGEISGSGYRSRGLTIAVDPGAQIVAPAAGRVAYSGRYRGYGTILIIEHQAGWTSLITNLATSSVAVGDPLVQGAPVGQSGSDDPTITVELRRHGRPIDIAALIG
ncbi:MAG: peptidoglycan DD-metalloendopeptidase family protein [Sphingomonadales bacterium]|nr:peptidoglycan DD-metalloendopeptidase family protein [Sphingomonadales bacterium]NCO49730.1 peptidoglycan DD-metalloendopeptidase family protein [Sphingomonadales bacterium]NCP00989.1 peptidoglycan DD-metalloendopeptidase family protein [Sphingomonadales bacterium]NCP25640.1 peptidoglycan DD-metalloendopeptidase family protein [Sphingomonadales bacterium]NCP49117.1 peptidoglycan DD-metalloendopeptidase family protein [Sphingomonadales bacterium]